MLSMVHACLSTAFSSQERRQRLIAGITWLRGLRIHGLQVQGAWEMMLFSQIL